MPNLPFNVRTVGGDAVGLARAPLTPVQDPLDQAECGKASMSLSLRMGMYGTDGLQASHPDLRRDAANGDDPMRLAGVQVELQQVASGHLPPAHALGWR